MPLQEGYVLSGLLIAEIMASIKENSILGYTVVPYLFEWKPPSYAYTKKTKNTKSKKQQQQQFQRSSARFKSFCIRILLN